MTWLIDLLVAGHIQLSEATLAVHMHVWEKPAWELTVFGVKLMNTMLIHQRWRFARRCLFVSWSLCGLGS